MRFLSGGLYAFIVAAAGGVGQFAIGYGPIGGWAPFLCAIGGGIIVLCIEGARGWPDSDDWDTW